MDDILVFGKIPVEAYLIVKLKTLFRGGVFEDGDDFDSDWLLCVGIDTIVYL